MMGRIHAGDYTGISNVLLPGGGALVLEKYVGGLISSPFLPARTTDSFGRWSNRLRWSKAIFYRR